MLRARGSPDAPPLLPAKPLGSGSRVPRASHLGVVHRPARVLGEQGSVLLRRVPAGAEPDVPADVLLWGLQQAEHHGTQVGHGHAIYGHVTHGQAWEGERDVLAPVS